LSSDTAGCDYQSQLAQITAACVRWQQRWPSPIKLVNTGHRAVEHDNATLPFDFPSPANNLPQPPTILLSGDAVDQSHAATTAACDRLQQRWPSMIEPINHSHCSVKQDDATLPFAPPSPATSDPRPSTTSLHGEAVGFDNPLQITDITTA